jgi:hypothetical protein
MVIRMPTLSFASLLLIGILINPSDRKDEKSPSGLFDADDLHRAEIHSILSAGDQVRWWCALCDIPVEPEFINNLAERIIRILFKEARAGIPAGPATDAGRTIDTDFHGHSLISGHGFRLSAPGFLPPSSEYWLISTRTQ